MDFYARNELKLLNRQIMAHILKRVQAMSAQAMAQAVPGSEAQVALASISRPELYYGHKKSIFSFG